MKKIFIILTSLSFIFCKKENVDEPDLFESILSASVAFSYSGSNLQSFLKEPGNAYVSGYFYFEDTLPNDVLFGLDIELMEGTTNPIRFEGVDWMAYAALNRNGDLWIPTGIPENLNGTVNRDNWEIKNIGFNLKPKIWYKMTIEANFDLLMFNSVRIEGDGQNVSVDLSEFQLQYPNYMPLDDSTLTFYTHSARSKNLSNNTEGNTKVYFDDIEGGISVGESYEIIFFNGFENQSEIQDVPVALPIIPLENIGENIWYNENENAKLKIVSQVSRSGTMAMECNADLKK